MRRFSALLLVPAALLSCAALSRQTPADLELRRLNFKNWPYAHSTRGSDPNDDAINRNIQKNRAWTATKSKVDWPVGKFTDTVAMYDMGLQIIGQSRKNLLLDQPSKLETIN